MLKASLSESSDRRDGRRRSMEGGTGLEPTRPMRSPFQREEELQIQAARASEEWQCCRDALQKLSFSASSSGSHDASPPSQKPAAGSGIVSRQLGGSDTHNQWQWQGHSLARVQHGTAQHTTTSSQGGGDYPEYCDRYHQPETSSWSERDVGHCHSEYSIHFNSASLSAVVKAGGAASHRGTPTPSQSPSQSMAAADPLTSTSGAVDDGFESMPLKSFEASFDSFDSCPKFDPHQLVNSNTQAGAAPDSCPQAAVEEASGDDNQDGDGDDGNDHRDDGGSEGVADGYSDDEFRMFEFKVRRCTRGRSHDWTECPFAHPGEKAKRRDPRAHRYSGTACPDYRKGSCRRGDACEFAHGVFEAWLHPDRYGTGSEMPRRHSHAVAQPSIKGDPS